MRNLVQFDTKTYAITGQKWDGHRQMVVISFEDENGNRFEAEAFGMERPAVRQAVVDELVRMTGRR